VATGRSLLCPLSTGTTALAFSSDGTKLSLVELYNSNSVVLSVFRLEPHRGIRALRGLSAQVTHAAFSLDGRKLAALSQNWELAVWTVVSNRLDHLLDAPAGESADNAALCFSPRRSSGLCDFPWSPRLGRGQWPKGRRMAVAKNLCPCITPAGPGRWRVFFWDREARDTTRRGMCGGWNYCRGQPHQSVYVAGIRGAGPLCVLLGRRECARGFGRRSRREDCAEDL